MASSENKTDVLAQELLEEIRETQTDFAAVKTELSILHENVKVLSRIIREGDGDTSILTRLALLSQKLDDLVKWKDGHHEAHQRIKSEIAKVQGDLDDLERKVLLIGKDVAEHDKKIADEEKAAKDSVEKQIELAHEQELSETKLKEERQKLFLKVLATFVIASMTFLAGYLLK